jgi:hypothetical protein
METIAYFMQDSSAILTLGVVCLVLGVVVAFLLASIAVLATFVSPMPGGPLTLAGVVVMTAMFLFSKLMTTTMEIQYGPAGTIVELSMYTFGALFCVLGYARVTWSIFRSRRVKR